MSTLTFDALIIFYCHTCARPLKGNYDCRTFIFNGVLLHCGCAAFTYVKHLLPPLVHMSHVYQYCLSVVCVVSLSWQLKFALCFLCVPGGDGGRPNGAGHSLHPCVYCERNAHCRAGYSRKGMDVPKRQQMWYERTHCHALNCCTS